MSEARTPVEAYYDGDVFRPVNDWWKARARKQYTTGEIYSVVDEPERSSASHRHFFAALMEAWRNLPDALLEQYPSVEHMRKKLLIKAGYCQERSIVCASRAEALRMAPFVAQFDTYAVAIPRGTVLSVYVAESQSLRAMGKQRFQQSKDAVLGSAAELIGVTKPALAAQRGAA